MNSGVQGHRGDPAKTIMSDWSGPLLAPLWMQLLGTSQSQQQELRELGFPNKEAKARDDCLCLCQLRGWLLQKQASGRAKVIARRE